MTLPELLETIMLLCFSASWYWLIRKVWKDADSRGMPKSFPLLVAIGFLMGLGAKVAVYAESDSLSPLVWLYAWNVIVSSAHLFLVVKLADQLDARRISGVQADQAAG